MKYIIFDFGGVLAYPPTGNWHLTPKLLELIDIAKLDRDNKNNNSKYIIINSLNEILRKELSL